MRTLRLPRLVVTLALAFGAVTTVEPATSAQQPPQPRDARPAPQPPRDPAQSGGALVTGKGSITGVVTVVGSGQPARRARVNLSAFADAGGSRTTTTDDQGRFAFNALPAGRFNLTASKPGHLSATYGQRRPGRQGTAIQLADGQRVQVQLAMWRGSVITGTVLDEYGEAIPGTPVRALRYVLQNGQRTLQSAGSGQTDDRGMYRMFGLQPGDYVVSAIPRNTGAGEIDRIQAEAVAVTQRIQALPAQSAAEAQARAERLTGLNALAPGSDEPASGYAPVYYPGTSSVANAATIVLNPGEEKSGIDFQYQVVPVARIEGFVTGGQTPQGVTVTLVSGTSGAPAPGPGSTRTDSQGAFRFNNVPPGQYTLVARASIASAGSRDGGPGGRGSAPGGRGGMLTGSPRGGPVQPSTRLWASAEIVVDGRNLSNVVLGLQPGMPVSGRVVFEGTQAPPTDLTRVRVIANPVLMPGMSGELMSSASASVEADGRFTITSLIPGRYRFTASAPGGSSGPSTTPGASSGWTLGSSIVDGQDSLDFPIDIKPNHNVTSAVLTFVDRQTELTGTIVDARAQPVLDYNLVVYPADQRFWTPQSRRIQSTRPATDGRFTFRNLPAGEYRLAPVLDPEPGSWFDPAFLQQLESNATRVTIAEGEKKEQTLRVATGG